MVTILKLLKIRLVNFTSINNFCFYNPVFSNSSEKICFHSNKRVLSE